jgi:DNA-binding NtrC family response regulator
VPTPDVVAVINTSPDTVEILRLALQHAGLAVVTAYSHDIREGRTDLGTFVTQHDPTVIVYDIAPPYAENWKLFEHVRSRPVMSGRQFVLTTTNEKHVRGLAAANEAVYEVVGLPIDLDAIVAAVKDALRSGGG